MVFFSRTALLLVSFFFIMFRTPALADAQEFCGIRLLSPHKIKFSETEKNWLCGDGKSNAWKVVPASQRTLFLKSFLQSRGYHTPTMSIKKDIVTADAGPLYRIKDFEVQGAPESWNWKKRRKLRELPMTPGNLDEFTKWARRRLQENSYACPQVDAQALVDESLFVLKVKPGGAKTFGFIQTRGEDSLDPTLLDRYTAFFPDQEFDIRLLELTSNRILAEDLYLSTYYDVMCDEQGDMTIVRRLIPAKPRLLAFGLGFDSEGGALFRSTLKHARVNPTADSLEASIYASLIEQTFQAKYRHYFSSDLRSRLHLVNSLSVKRETEDSYEALTSQLGLAMAYGWELRDHQALVQAGPALERTDIIVGPGPYRLDTIRINTEATVTSHLYEYYLTEPQRGWTATLNTSTQLQGALSKENVHRVSLRHQALWNWQEWDPAIMIIGWRGHIGSFFIDDTAAEQTDIPITQKFFLGGDANLRGFGRKQIQSASGAGYLTMFYQGLELRTGDVLPYKIQPLIFLDAAMAGATATRLQQTIYYSPGFGIRWASPFGAIRGTLGRGYIIDPPDDSLQPGYQFYFSFGKEF